jgi:DNA invertase Pin-like site-specific DNA recombinase
VRRLNVEIESHLRTRTSEGLQAAKAKGIKLGNPRWQDSIEGAREARDTNAAKQRKLVRPIIEGMRSSGISTLTGLAEALNERRIPRLRAGDGIL